MSEVRLRALRMVGFKSFAEKTVVEFGPGISAVVGPNGSGKSNLADALRWALGEQGRSLRTRRAEDVIFAGSSSRRAIGMADVALVIDNGDRLLPVDYAEVELGRRLFRSGENEYLLNRQRVRLRDLVDLLDAANLADNAFLFIGQGMVDQALALRPEERRPLFEEAAGIRRHDRRRRHAEVELAEAEANLERVRDVLAELRPQARRLAAQAEQQEARRSAGMDLAAALVVVARDRLTDALAASEAHRATLAAAHRDADAALADLRAAEEATMRVSRALAEHADQERAARADLDVARSATVELRMAETRLIADSAGLERDRTRLAEDREAAELRLNDARRAAAAPIPPDDPSAEATLRDVDAAIAAADARLAELHDVGLAIGQREESALRERAARQADIARLRQQDELARRRSAEQERDAAQTAERAAATEEARATAAASAARSARDEAVAEAAADAARADLVRADAALEGATSERGNVSAKLDAVRGALAAAESALAPSGDDRLLRSARARGGQSVAEGLDVDSDRRLAVEAVLGDALTGVLLDLAAIPAVAAAGSGTIVARDGVSRPRAVEAARFEVAAVAAGGGRLVDAVRRDPGGAVTSLLSRAVWVPDLPAALSLRSSLPAGWRVATNDGALVSDDGVIRVGQRGSRLQRQADAEELRRTTESLEAALTAAVDAATTAARERDTIRQQAEAGRRDIDAARRARRIADDGERVAARAAEAAARESAWSAAQSERARTAAAMAAEAIAQALAEEAPEASTIEAGGHSPARSGDAVDPETATIEQRLAGLRDRRDRVAAAVSAGNAARGEAEERRRRAEVAVAMDEAQLARLDAEMGRLVGLAADAIAQRERVSAERSDAAAREARLTAALDMILRSGGADRQGLLLAERATIDARERLRAAEGRSRAAEVGEMEARLQADGVREQLLVELAGIGDAGLDALVAEASEDGAIDSGALPAPTNSDDLSSVLERALDTAVASWRMRAALDSGTTRGPAHAVGAGRLGALRRRYHELGASNPFAAREYAEVRERLETLDAQREDLTAAIRSTRELITELNTLISTQFRTTFAALEDAFGRRFRQLFDGGEAQLALTDPSDLSTTGVEITARPPGKKRQPLAMLSGGERALTAVALLMAMLEVRPVPFCVLDEVDAALDEANIGRFSAALRSLAERIQFIVITHNRGTIEAADALYGVTVGDDAVSHVISLRLGDIELDERRVVAIPVA